MSLLAVGGEIDDVNIVDDDKKCSEQDKETVLEVINKHLSHVAHHKQVISKHYYYLIDNPDNLAVSNMICYILHVLLPYFNSYTMQHNCSIEL